MYRVFLAIVLAIVIAITLHNRPNEEKEVIGLYQDEIHLSSSSSEEEETLEEDAYYGGTPYIEELDSPVAYSSSASSSEPKKYRPPRSRQFAPLSSSSVSSVLSISSSSSSASSSSAKSASSVSKPLFCQNDDYLLRYSDEGSKEAARLSRNKYCRLYQ